MNHTLTTIRVLKRLMAWSLKYFPFLERRILSRRNVFNTDFKKRALLIYIIEPFMRSPRNVHQNRRQVKVLAEELSGSGYNVDVVDYRMVSPCRLDVYDFIIGFGELFEYSFTCDISAKRVFYATTPHSTQRNMAEASRAGKLYERRGYTVLPQRLVRHPDYLSVTCADAIFATGNEWVRSTYQPFTKAPIHSLSISTVDTFEPENLCRSFGGDTTHLLWVGGYGALMKGLDILIEALCCMDQSRCVLHIVGDVRSDPLVRIYRRAELLERVYWHGELDLHSSEFKNIAQLCEYVVCPSASEAGCGGVLSAMATGLIPVVTDECTIQVSQCGVRIPDGDVDGVVVALRAATNLTIAARSEYSIRSARYARTRHSLGCYRESVRRALDCVL